MMPIVTKSEYMMTNLSQQRCAGVGKAGRGVLDFNACIGIAEEYMMSWVSKQAFDQREWHYRSDSTLLSTHHLQQQTTSLIT